MYMCVHIFTHVYVCMVCVCVVCMVLCTTTTTTMKTTTTMCNTNEAVDEVDEDDMCSHTTAHYERAFEKLLPEVKEFVRKFGRRDGDVRETLTSAMVEWAWHVKKLHAKHSEVEEFKYFQQRDGAKGDMGKPSDEDTARAVLLENLSTEKFKRHRDLLNDYGVLQATKKAKGAPHPSSSPGGAQAPEASEGSENGTQAR